MIWDYLNGDILCSQCGLVYDKLTSLEVLEYNVESVDTRRAKSSKYTTSRSKYYKSTTSREHRDVIKLYRKALKFTRNKPWLEVDYDKLFKDGKFVFSIKSRASIEALKNIKSSGIGELVEEGLRYIYSVNPAYLTRSERSRYALAFIVATMLKTGNYPSRENVVKIFNISNTSYRRLCLITQRIVSNLVNRVNELNQ